MAYYGDNGPFAWVSMYGHGTASIDDSLEYLVFLEYRMELIK